MQKVYQIKEYFAAVVAILRSTFTLPSLQNLKVNSIASEAR